ncbi:hypothetical protein CDAR_456531 [Caerostris darwini]|uniref:Uncharacterized protein n=1 Tax=Caerostris darwini TaxID=1538125 RepID=A0AAV4V9T3_9ARAC|nr:hypothetical protein CDAR_456531 [Caerostris darwini]
MIQKYITQRNPPQTYTLHPIIFTLGHVAFKCPDNECLLYSRVSFISRGKKEAIILFQLPSRKGSISRPKRSFSTLFVDPSCFFIVCPNSFLRRGITNFLLP